MEILSPDGAWLYKAEFQGRSPPGAGVLDGINGASALGVVIPCLPGSTG